jgi:hypothetical protein
MSDRQKLTPPQTTMWPSPPRLSSSIKHEQQACAATSSEFASVLDLWKGSSLAHAGQAALPDDLRVLPRRLDAFPQSA